MSGDGHALRTDKITLQTILQRGYEAYARTHALPDYVRRAVWAILACRTALLGGHVQACPEGHLERIWYNSCRHRMCPQCAWLQIERWLVRQKARLLACEHYHAIFTMPHELNDLWLANVAVMSGLLFASVHDTLLELLSDAKYLGAKPGIIATLHTWSQTLILHPHIHCLVTGGGRHESGHWVAVQQRVSPAHAGGHGGLPGQAASGHPPGVGARDAPAARGPEPAARGESAQQAGPPEVERAYPGALSLWAGGADLPGAVSARRPHRFPAVGLV